MVDLRLSVVKRRSMRSLTMPACQQAPVPRHVTPTPVASPKTSPLAACAATAASPGPQVLLQNQPAPDDLVFDNAGRLFFSDIKRDFVSALNADGSVERIAGGMSAPEGIVVQADGRILVGEQGRNRVGALAPKKPALTLWPTV